jgi:hypothetical protein
MLWQKYKRANFTTQTCLSLIYISACKPLTKTSYLSGVGRFITHGGYSRRDKSFRIVNKTVTNSKHGFIAILFGCSISFTFLSVCLPASFHQGKAMWTVNEKLAICQPEREPLPEPDHAGIFVLCFEIFISWIF